MKRKTITIRNANADNIQIQIYIELSEDGTVWMTKNKIASLFNVHRSSVETSLKSLFKSNRLLENGEKGRTLTVLPLAECRKDILPLAEFFREQSYLEFNKKVILFDAETQKMLQAY